MPLPPGPKEPAVLQTVEWIARPTALLRRARAQHGDPFTLRTLWVGAPLVVTSDPAAAKAIIGGDPQRFHAGESSKHLEPFVGPYGILVLDGPAHLRQRRLMLPPFHGERLRAHRDTIAELARAEVAAWPRGEAFRTLPRMRALTLRVIEKVIFGGHDAALHAAVRGALDHTASLPRMLALGVIRRDFGPRSPMGRFMRSVGEVDRLLYERIERADAPLESVVGMLLAARHEDGAPPAPQELRDQLVTLLAAGHETTATALAWALERLARHPQLQAQLRANPDDDALLDAVVKETLRVRPVLSIAARRLTEPATIAGHELPARTHVAASIYLLHRRADCFGPDPLAFRPSRWLGEDPPADASAWIPFGGGVRRCVGAAFAALEMREALRAVASSGIELAPERAEGERMRRESVVLAPARGARVIARLVMDARLPK